MNLRRRFFFVQLVLLAGFAIVAAGAVTRTAADVVEADHVTDRESGGGGVQARDGASVSRDFGALSDANIFDGRRENVDGLANAIAPGDPGSCEEAPRTSLRLELVGTVVSPLAEASSASISDGKAEADIYAVDDVVGAAGATLKVITPERVCLWNPAASRFESLSLDDDVVDGPRAAAASNASSNAPSGPASSLVHQVAAGKFEVRRKDLDDVMNGGFAAVAQDARFIPAFEDGKVVGFKLAYVKPGSALSGALKRGDVVKAVNGYELGSLDSSIAVLGKLKDQSSFAFDVKRGDAPVTLELAIVP